MSNIKLTTLNELYNYLDANIYRHSDIFSLNIDIETLTEIDKVQAHLILDSLKYSLQCGKLVPFFTDTQGNSYPNIETLTDNEINYFLNYINISKNYYVIATINHFLFIKVKSKNKMNFAQNAINAYLSLFKKYQEFSEKEHWYELSIIFNNLTDLAFRANYKINEVKDLSIYIVKNTSIHVLRRDAVEFLVAKVKKKKFKKTVLKGFIKICKNNINQYKDDINWSLGFIELGREISKVQNGNLVQWDLLQAKAYENEMNRALKLKNNNIVAASWCKDAIQYYKKSNNKHKANKLYKKYNNLCKNISYTQISGPKIDLKDDIKKLNEYIDKSEPIEVLKTLIYDFIPIYENNKNNAEKNFKGLLTSFFPISYTDIYGQIVGYANTDEEKLRHELWETYKFDFAKRSFILQQYIFYALKTNKLNEYILLEYFRTTWYGDIITKALPDKQKLKYQWLEHIKEPIISYFEKQRKYACNSYFRLTYINEVDSLILKIEGILRDLIDFTQIDNFTVRKFVNDVKGRQVSYWKSLNELLWDNNISQILSKNDVWFMRYFLTDYLNTRNNIAHCLVLNPYQEEYYYGFQWILIILLRLSLYIKRKNKPNS